METYSTGGSNIIRLEIGTSILELLSDNNLSVKNICEKACVSRTTFYRYYGNKNGISNCLYDYFVILWEQQLKLNIINKVEHNILLLNFLFDNKDNILLLRKHNLDYILDDFIIKIFGPKDSNDEYYVKYFQSGIFIGLLKALIENEFNTTVDEVTNQIFSHIINTTKQAI